MTTNLHSVILFRKHGQQNGFQFGHWDNPNFRKDNPNFRE